MLIQIGPEREQNGRDDSDWSVSVLDLETGKIVSCDVGTTRAANALPCEATYRRAGIVPLSELSEVDRARFEGMLWAVAINHAMSQENWRIMRLEPLFGGVPGWLVGKDVKTKEPVRNRNRKTEPCIKCSGTGRWVNPRNEHDKRKCFLCSGKGSRSVLAKGMRTLPVGTAGTVLHLNERKSQFGTWSYGVTVRVRCHDGSEFNAQLSALRLAEDPDLKRARDNAIIWHDRAMRAACTPIGVAA